MITKRILVPILLTAMSLINAAAAELSILSQADRAACDRWVDSVYSTMSLKQRVGQLFVPKLNPANVATAKTSIARLINEYGIGGLLFSKGTIEQYAVLTNYAQSLSKVPLMMTLDGEWGLAMRVTGAPKFPYNMTLGAIADDSLLYEYGREVARECAELGITVNFAPVLDVNSNPANPVIGYRSFGENPSRVGALGTAYSRGLEAGGVMAVGKHFPGHGDTDTDSHKALPVINHSIAQLDSVDLIPFRQFIDAGMGGIMVGHLDVPSLDASSTPASLSSAIVTRLLKEKMGFEGIVWTDGLAMKGAAVGSVNNCVSALLAGNDLLLEPLSPISDMNAVLAAVKDGTIPESLIERNCRKMLAWKYALGLHKKPANIATAGVKGRIDTPAAQALIQKLTAASVICLENADNLLPVDMSKQPTVAVVNIGEAADNTFTKFCRKYAKVDAYTTPLSAAQLSAVKKHDIVIAAVYGSNAAAVSQYRQLAGHAGLVTVFFMNPYKTSGFAPLGSSTTMLIGENTRLAQEYMAQGIFGGIRVNGVMPVNVSGIGNVGQGVGLLKTVLGYTTPEIHGIRSSVIDSIDALVSKGLAQGAFPGCQVVIAKGGDIIVEKSYGFTDNTKAHHVTDSTIYDIASVSKIAGTLPGLMLAYDNSLFTLEEAAASYIPQLATADKGDITVRELLLHESGMPATINIHRMIFDHDSYNGRLLTSRMRAPNTIKVARGLYGNTQARLRKDLTSHQHSPQFCFSIAKGIYACPNLADTIMERIYNVDRRKTKAMHYSDLNFALLMQLEQNITGLPHEDYVMKGIWGPLGARHTGYRAADHFPVAQIAPTENDRFMRKQMLQGYVHDELAAFSGGVQGNAGLFSTAAELARLGQMWLNGGNYGSNQIMSEETVRLFTTSRSLNSRRRLGFDGPDVDNPDKSPVPEQASASTYGHIGFTGTCIWIDPENELVYVFLSNRVHPTRDNRAFSKLNIRPAIMEAIYNSALPHQ